MLNPMFEFLHKDPSAQKVLSHSFAAIFKYKTFAKSTSEYLLVDLPFEKTQFTLNGKKLMVVGQHFTIPKDLDKKTHSTYHYTLVLTDVKTKKDYKIHYYFDELDRITKEPKLYDDTSNRFNSLTSEEMESVQCFAMFCTDFVSSLRKMQTDAVGALRIKIADRESKLVALSEDLIRNKQSYIETLHDQIEDIKKIESIGCLSFKEENKFYTKMVEKLEQSPIELKSSVQNTLALPPIVTFEHKYTAERAKLVPRSTTKQTSSSSDYQNFIQACQRHIKEFDEATVPKPKLIKDMINKIVECRSMPFFFSEASSSTSLLKVKSGLTSRVAKFFNGDNMATFWDHYMLAAKANILPITSELIEAVLKTDNVSVLKSIITLNVVSDTTTFVIFGRAYTLPQWCIHFGSVKCLNELLANKFSLDYVDDEQSPFIAVLTNPTQYEKFFVDNLDRATIKQLTNKSIRILEKRLAISSGDEKKILIIAIENIRVNLKVIFWFSKNPQYKKEFFNLAFKQYKNAEMFNKLCPTQYEMLKKHVEVQQSYLALNQSMLQLLQAITPQLFGLFIQLMKGVSESMTLPSLKQFETMRDMPIDKLAELVITGNIENIVSLNSLVQTLNPSYVPHTDVLEELQQFVKRSKIARKARKMELAAAPVMQINPINNLSATNHQFILEDMSNSQRNARNYVQNFNAKLDEAFSKLTIDKDQNSPSQQVTNWADSLPKTWKTWNF